MIKNYNIIESLLKICPDWKLWQLCLCSLSILILSIIIMYITQQKIFKLTTTNAKLSKNQQTSYRYLTIKQLVLWTCAILSTLYFISGLVLYNTGKKHGMYQSGLTCQEIQKSIELSPTESILTHIDQKQILIIYYKFGCKDCEAIYKNLNGQLSNMDNTNIYWISTRSTQGIQLREQYPVSKVPSGVYIKENGTPVTLQLYETKENDIVINQENLDVLLQMYKEQL